MEAMIGWTEGKPAGNSMGRVPWGRSKMEATRRWTEGKPWEIAWGELRGEVARRKRREGGRGETVGNSMGRAPVGRSDERVEGNRGK